MFSNWIPFRRQIEDIGLVQRQNITLDLSDTKLVDHSVMEQLHEMQETFTDEGLELKIIGLESHSATGKHEMAARLGGLVRMRRLTVLAESSLADRIERICDAFEVDSYSMQDCRGRKQIAGTSSSSNQKMEQYVRVEVVGNSSTCESIVMQIRNECSASDSITVYAEAIHLMRLPQGAYA